MPADYSNQNLRGRSFKSQDLEGANFSGADIRGANFTGTNLKGADFSYADIRGANFSKANLKGVKFKSIKAGFVYHRIFITVLLSLIMTISVLKLLYSYSPSVVKLGLFWFYSNHIFLRFFPFALFAEDDIESYFHFKNLIDEEDDDWVKEYRKSKIKWGYMSLVSWVLNLNILNIAKSLIIIYYFKVSNNELEFILFILLAFTFPVEALVCHLFIRRVSDEYRRAETVSRMLRISSISGYISDIFEGKTNFQNADLTDADFSDANLWKASFKGALLTRVKWFKVESPKPSLKRSNQKWRDEAEILTKQLLISGNGSNKNFNYMDLSSTNLSDTNLTYASFVGTDLSNSNLQNANLTGTNLKQVKLEGTDLRGAVLTGAYIEDWGITSTTKLDGVQCKYVYMRVPTKENPDPLRKPDNNKEVFVDGEFGDFIKPIVETLDLYHTQGVDPRAIAISFKQLAENHPDAELRIVGMEVRGENKLLLRAKTATNVDKSQLSAEYFDTYNHIKALPERQVKLLLAEKDSRIRSLETMVITALERPNFYSNTQVGQVSTMTNNPGGFSVGGSVGGDVKNLQGDNNRAIQGNNNQGVLGDNNQVSQQNQVGVDAETPLTKEDVVKLLAELEALVKTAELPAETKEEVIEDLSSASKATDKEEPNKNRALERLGSVAETLEKTSKTVESGQKIWTTAKPIIVKIATWLGAAAGSHLLGL